MGTNPRLWFIPTLPDIEIDGHCFIKDRILIQSEASASMNNTI